MDIITPRPRLAREISAAYGAQQSLSVWTKPRVFVIGEWIQNQLSPLLRRQGTMLSNAATSALLWGDALAQMPSVAKQDIGWDIFSAAEERMQQRFIRQAQQAWRIIHLYDISLERKDYRDFALPGFFHRWALLYQQLCAEKKLLDEWQAPVEFNRCVYEGTLHPATSLWVGWTDMPPLYRKLWELLIMRKAAVQKLPSLTQKKATITRMCYSYSNEEQELSHLAQRVRIAYDKDRGQTIGVVIPSLKQSRHRVRRIFRAAFGMPALEELVQHTSFDISGGERIESHPVIGDLLNLLELTRAARPMAELLQLFQSPYIRGTKEEQASRFTLNSELIGLSARQTHLSVYSSLRLSSKGIFTSCPLLRRAVEKFFKVPRAFDSQASPCHWADVFNQQAAALGWGAVENWSSQEIYLRDRWMTMLNALYSMHRVLPRCTRARALSFLRAQAYALFQTRGGNTKIRLLGVREAEGLSFDRLFVCQMNEYAIARPSANFFIPYGLGQAAKVPGYGVELNWQAEQRLMDHLLQAAPIIEFSYADRADGEEQLIHPRLREFALRKEPNPPQFVVSKRLVEKQDDSMAPRVAPTARLRSVVRLIQEQAACPFRSFSRFRLNIQDPPQLVEQVGAQDRGTMLHNLLKEIWERLSSQRELKRMDKDRLRQLIQTTAAQWVKRRSEQNVFLCQEIVAEVERQYLVDLATRLLEYDESRPVSFRIDALEEKKELKDFCGYDFSLRVDRIDKIEAQAESAAGLMLLDYKNTTRTLSASSLMGKRPAEPQLLIYSLLVVDNLKSVGFLVLNLKRGVTSAGLSLTNEALPGYKVVTAEELAEMQQRLKGLFDNFLQGHAAVDPKSRQTCARCSYKPLCRIGAP